MNISRLDIEQQRAIIRIEVTNARLHVEYPEGRLDIKHSPPEMNVSREEPAFSVDIKSLHQSFNMRDIETFAKDRSSRAKGLFEEGLRRTTADAAFTAEVTQPGNRLAQAAERRLLEVKEPPMNTVGKAPGALDMEGRGGSIIIDWTPNELDISWEGETMPRMYVEPPYSVEVYIEQQPYLKISVEQDTTVKIAGRQVDTLA